MHDLLVSISGCEEDNSLLSLTETLEVSVNVGERTYEAFFIAPRIAIEMPYEPIDGPILWRSCIKGRATIYPK